MNDIEKLFAEHFIKKEYRPRILYELSSLKKRGKALSRFAHDAENILKKECIYQKKSSFTIQELICEFGFYEKVYILSEDGDDAHYLNFEEALSRMMNDYLAKIFIFSGDSAFIKTEAEDGSSMKFILKYK